MHNAECTMQSHYAFCMMHYGAILTVIGARGGLTYGATTLSWPAASTAATPNT